jgi:ABC-type transport system involved in multi-copper enzyme maturation permease subunit
MLLGPVLAYEWKAACPAQRHFRLRWLYALVLVAELLFFLFGWVSRAYFRGYVGAGNVERVGPEIAWQYFEFFAAQHFLLVLLATPAVAAGSVTDEKARGTLALALTTELSAADLILGKWLAHVGQVTLLALAALPVIVFMALLGGLPAATVLVGAVETALLTGALAAAALLASVWARRTTNAVLGVYAVGGALVLGTWVAGYGSLFEQLSVMAVRNRLADHGWWRAGWFGLMLALVAVTAGCLVIAAWRLRPALAKQLTASRRFVRWLPWASRPPVGDAPMRWKERYVGELGLLSFVRFVPRWLLLAGTGALGLGMTYLVGDDDGAVFVHGLALMLVVGVLVAVRASGSISGERERRTWEGLLLTPAEPYTLIRGKLWGIHDSIRPYLVAYFVPALPIAVATGFWPAFCLVVCWVLAWALMYYLTAQGLVWSARLDSSWRSLAYTLGSAVYTGGLRAALAALPISFLMFVITAAGCGCVAPALFSSTPTAWYGMTLLYFIAPVVVALFGYAEELLQEAERQIALTERTIQVLPSWRRQRPAGPPEEVHRAAAPA